MRLRRNLLAYRHPAVLCVALAALAIAPFQSLQATAHTPSLSPVAQISTPEALPRPVLRRLKRSLAQQVGVAPRQLRLVGYSQETWPDGCLGLGGIAELCLAALVPGWRVGFTDGETQWHVRSNQDGSVFKLEPTQTSETLPDAVRDAVFDAVVTETGVSLSQLQLVTQSRETWPDGCLGLAGPGMRCTEALVEGWHVIVTDGVNQASYRTNLDGSAVWLESTQIAERLPDAVREVVLAAAAEELGQPVDQLYIDSAQARTFDGCFGIDPGEGGACTMIAISGWQVIVSSDRQTWVYHSYADGSQIRLNPTAGVDAQRVQLTILPESDRLQVPSDIVFRAQTAGGFTGMVYETTLYRDGRIVRSPIYVPFTAPPEQIGQLTPEQVTQFERQLQRSRLGNVSGLRYQSATPAADYATVTLACGGHVVQYEDVIADQLPADLQQAVALWQSISIPN